MLNTKIIETKQELLSVINHSKLPIAVIQLIINELKNTIDVAVVHVLKQEEAELKQHKEQSVSAPKDE